jgi:ElaB/YqjD/DUF883 family membrane-anchored ribosome-binding protein
MTDTTATGETFGGRTDATGGIRETAATEAQGVKREVGTQARRLMDQVGAEVNDQATEQQKRAAGGLRGVGSQLRQMADNSDGQGMAVDLVSQAASRADSAASWLDDRDPGALLEEVKSFARRRPGLFIAIAAGAGIVAGRLTKALMSGDESGSGKEFRNRDEWVSGDEL